MGYSQWCIKKMNKLTEQDIINKQIEKIEEFDVCTVIEIYRQGEGMTLEFTTNRNTVKAIINVTTDKGMQTITGEIQLLEEQIDLLKRAGGETLNQLREANREIEKLTEMLLKKKKK